jgi:hypothetical protein
MYFVYVYENGTRTPFEVVLSSGERERGRMMEGWKG